VGSHHLKNGSTCETFETCLDLYRPSFHAIAFIFRPLQQFTAECEGIFNELLLSDHFLSLPIKSLPLMNFSVACSPSEKDVDSLRQPPLSPNTTSSTSTLLNRSSLGSLLHLARSGFSLIHSKRKIHDVEDQVEAEDKGVIGPVFDIGGLEGTKVRKRKIQTLDFQRPQLTNTFRS
jgi:hypothetical protein